MIYTDGVSEAQNPAGEFFDVERLREAIERQAAGSASAITAGLLGDVKTFAATAPQSDDITILTLKVALETETGTYAGTRVRSCDDRRTTHLELREARP